MTEQPSTNPESLILDEKWRKKFEKNGNLKAHLWLDCENEKTEKPKFLSGASENPNLIYEKLDAVQLTKIETELLNLKKEVRAEEPDELIRQVYLWKIDEKIGEVKMLLASTRGEMTKFKHYSRFVFGEPDLQVFAHTVESLKNEITAAENSDNPELTRAAAELAKVLPPFVATVSSEILIPPPSHETFVNLRERVRKKFKKLLALVEEKSHNSTELSQVFDKGLTEIGASGWQSELDPKRLVISIKAERDKILIPTEKNYAANRVPSLLIHEIGNHTQQIVNGRRSRLQLLGVGLDRDTSGFEGVATLTGNLATNPEKFKEYEKLDRHLAISLGAGLDGKPRNFREVFEVMQKYYFFKAIKAGKDPAAAEKSANNQAWTSCVRTFRGSDCQTRGAVFTKDIAYAEGDISHWKILGQNPDLLEKIGVGRIDLANPRHRKILQKLNLGFSAADFAGLEDWFWTSETQPKSSYKQAPRIAGV